MLNKLQRSLAIGILLLASEPSPVSCRILLLADIKRFFCRSVTVLSSMCVKVNWGTATSIGLCSVGEGPLVLSSIPAAMHAFNSVNKEGVEGIGHISTIS